MPGMMGNCSRCGVRCMTATGADRTANSRGRAVASAAVSGRQLAYVIESIEKNGQDLARLICRECVVHLAGGREVAA